MWLGKFNSSSITLPYINHILLVYVKYEVRSAERGKVNIFDNDASVAIFTMQVTQVTEPVVSDLPFFNCKGYLKIRSA